MTWIVVNVETTQRRSSIGGALFALGVALAAGGCGAQTGLSESIDGVDRSDAGVPLDSGPMRDALPDAPRLDGGNDADAATDASIDAPPAPLRLACSASRTMGEIGDPIAVTARVSGGVSPGPVQYSLMAPPSSSAMLSVEGNRARLVGDVRGTYEVRASVADSRMQMAECSVAIEITNENTPPEAICPANVRAVAGEEVVLEGEGQDEDGSVSLSWALEETPPGSDVSEVINDNGLARFTPDVAGTYVLGLTVTDSEGATARCETRVDAQPPPAEPELRVELSWQPVGTDADLHLLHPDADSWSFGGAPLDCHFFNCDTTPLQWFTASRADDPQLDMDSLDGRRPETIRIDDPAAAVYRVGVHNWPGTFREIEPRVRIFCGEDPEPDATFGPVDLGSDQFWKVADVEVDASGARCEIESLAHPDGSPRIVPASEADRRR